jgi:hypothetical protein
LRQSIAFSSGVDTCSRQENAPKNREGSVHIQFDFSNFRQTEAREALTRPAQFDVAATAGN